MINIKPIILNESANTFSGKIIQTIVNMRKPFKKYGELLPQKPDISSHLKSGGSSHLFDYKELLNDSRPSRLGS